jgi:hypothetical protein
MDSMLRARDESAALLASGYVMTGSKRRACRAAAAYRVTARADLGVGASLGDMRYGSALPIDHSIYRAGQQVFMDAGPGTRLVAPSTASFAVQDPVAGPSGLSAGHCGAPAPQNTGLTVQRAYLPNVRLRLGRGDPRRRGKRLRRARVRDRQPLGHRAADRARGSAPLDGARCGRRSLIGRGARVCFAGRTTGAETCGRVKGFKQHPRCVGVKARSGDSGGPVYYDPGNGLTTQAVGIVTTDKMCFTPISRVLGRFGVTFPPGPFLR